MLDSPSDVYFIRIHVRQQAPNAAPPVLSSVSLGVLFILQPCCVALHSSLHGNTLASRFLFIKFVASFTGRSWSSLPWPGRFVWPPCCEPARRCRTPGETVSALQDCGSAALGGLKAAPPPMPAMPGPAASKARVYAEVNTLKSKDYWDYEAHVPSWRYINLNM